MSTTGERIKKARIEKRLTQTELADLIGVKFSAIHKYESGIVVNLKRETIEALAKALDVKPSYLLCIDEEPDFRDVEKPTVSGELNENMIDDTIMRLASRLDRDQLLELSKRLIDLAAKK